METKFKITSKNKNDRRNVWNTELESLAALFSIAVEKHRGINKTKVCHELNKMFIRKKEGSFCPPTPFQKDILKNKKEQ